MIALTRTKQGHTFAVRLVPRASKSEIVGEHEGALRVRIAAAPVDGAANDELIKLLARRFTVPASSVEIIKGVSGRTKRILIHEDDESALRKVLDGI